MPPSGRGRVQLELLDLLRQSGGEASGMFEIAYLRLGSRHAYDAVNRLAASGLIEVQRGTPGRNGRRTRLILKQDLRS